MLGFIKKMFGIGSAPAEAAPYKVEVPAASVAQTATQAMIESLTPEPSAAEVTADNKSKAVAAVKRVPAKKTPVKKTQKKPTPSKTPVK